MTLIASAAAALPAHAASAAEAAKAKPRSAFSLPSNRECLSTNRLTVRLRARGIAKVVRINVNGKRVRTLRGRRLTSRVTLRHLRGAVVKTRRTGKRRRTGKVLVTVTVVKRSGRKVTTRRRYRLCSGAPGGPGSADADGFGAETKGSRRALPGCANDTVFPGRTHPGGEWPVNGQDYDSTRTQEKESVIGVDQARTLGKAWTFSSKKAGGEGDFTGTPIVRDGCVYAASTRGWVFAINADNGRLVWKTKMPRGGRTYQSVNVRYGKVFIGLTAGTATDSCTADCAQPFMVGLDQESGRIAWESPGLDSAGGADILGAPLVFDASDNGVSDPVVFTGISAYGAEADFGDGSLRYGNDGSFVLLDAGDGAVLKQTYTVKKDPTDENAGCGIWSSPALDFETRRGYVGVSNPHNPKNEHPNCNSVIEFVADRTAPDFGQILRNFKGTPEDYFSGEFQQFPCLRVPFVPNPTPSQEVGTCTDMDLAIGAPPNLIRSADGRKMVGVGQKSGHYHLWDIATGERKWRSFLGIPTLIGGIVGGTAYDGERIYGPSTVPGFVFAADKGTGSPAWIDQHSVVSYGNPTTTANGVVYTTTQRNYLNAYEAKTGAPLLELPLPPSTDAEIGFQGTVGGVAVARNTVYAAVGTQSLPEGFIVALRPGAANDDSGGGDPSGDEGSGDPSGQPGQGGGGTSPTGSYILAGPGAVSTGFPAAAMPRGSSLAFVNFDNTGHDVRSVDKSPDGQPLFRSEIGTLATPTPVLGAEKLAGGKSYEFLCTIHPSMRGTLAVGP